MARFGFCGPSYSSQSVAADAQRCMNLYLENIESGDGKTARALYRTPGLSVAYTLPNVPLAQYNANGRLFAVANGHLYELLSNLTSTDRGAMAGSGGLTGFASSQTQLLIVSGGNAFCFNLTTNSFQAITGIAFSNPIMCGFSDGYFIVLFGNSQKF